MSLVQLANSKQNLMLAKHIPGVHLTNLLSDWANFTSKRDIPCIASTFQLVLYIVASFSQSDDFNLSRANHASLFMVENCI